jgi:hypothetical protein
MCPRGGRQSTTGGMPPSVDVNEVAPASGLDAGAGLTCGPYVLSPIAFAGSHARLARS